ncbi:MAG: hypothetical protein Q8922_13425 [Bacteroidota bacterium]|nr:hypothetical protein [Bacteroidota bacterium]MDP4233865.1 hypothetical protein [Bacteroidota bacterium]MDP4243538.1 hypothetical protein [Bacteroidota bacterium]MDP4288923.1 hypothetical protein [Bacteroidota bacterium]
MRVFARSAALVLLLLASSAFATWKQIATFNGLGRVTAAYFFDATTGIIGFDRATYPNVLERTTDGGLTWTACGGPPATTSSNYVTDIWFKNGLEGWATSGTQLWHSTDAGGSWHLTPDAGQALVGIRETSHALVASSYNPWGMTVSTDGGNTFTATLPGGSTGGVDFVDDLHGAASAVWGSFVFTTDGGVTWNNSMKPGREVWSLCGIPGTSVFIGASEGGLVATNGAVYRSTDYGVTWSVLSTLPNITGGIAGNGGILYLQLMGQSPTGSGLYRSLDSGVTWTPIGGPSNYFDCRFAVNECAIYAFDNAGGVWVTTDGGDGAQPDTLGFHLALAQDTTAPGYIVSLSLLSDRTLPDFTVKSIDGVIHFFQDAFNSFTMRSIGGSQLFDTVYTLGDSTFVAFRLVNTQGIQLDSLHALLSLGLQVVVSKASASDPSVNLISLDSLAINQEPTIGDNAQLVACPYGKAARTIVSHVRFLCGDQELQTYLKTGSPLVSSPLRPNPVSSADNYQTSIRLTVAEDGTCTITLFDALGRIVRQEQRPMTSGSSEYEFDLKSFPGGSYFYGIQFVGEHTRAMRNGTIVLVK